MAAKKYLKGPKLFSLARKKALRLDIPQPKGIKLSELISKIQISEGNKPCYQLRETCNEVTCCWQASCNAAMIKDDIVDSTAAFRRLNN